MPRNHPLQFDPVTDEPYIALPSPHSNIRITPPRLNDVDAIVRDFNDPLIYPYLVSPPLPYTAQDAENSIRDLKASTDAVYAHIEPLLAQDGAFDTKLLAPGCPVRCIREVLPDGTDVYIGDIGISRDFHRDEVPDAEREKSVEENKLRPTGDPNIIWTFSSRVSPSHHGRGIMSSAVNVILHQWAVPHMNAHHVTAAAFTDNIGSQKVFLKNGFTYVGTANTIHNDLRHKGRLDNTLAVFEWKSLM